MKIQLKQPLPQLVEAIDTEFGHYEVWDTLYAGRPSRVLYSGHRQTAQSAIAVDDNPNLVFDYNQRFMELVRGLSPKRLLLIGGGAFTLPIALLAALPELCIDVVEINDQLAELARRHFGLLASPGLNIVNGDGRAFLEQSREHYDLILIDAFQHSETPESLTDEGAAKLIRQRLHDSGLVAYNTIATYRGLKSVALHRRVTSLRSAFPTVIIYPASADMSHWLQQNYVLVGARGNTPDFDTYLRFPHIAVYDAD